MVSLPRVKIHLQLKEEEEKKSSSKNFWVIQNEISLCPAPTFNPNPVTDSPTTPFLHH
jgi:hypothetical protein